ncbi:MAG: DUF2652 domain-containing protein [Acidimicrobiia bacterium]
MTTHLPDAERGYLLLADITGYTDYLQGSELEHAQDVLADLLETIIAGIEPPFVLSKLEGDAAFAYASADAMTGAMLLDALESTYFSFKRRLRDIRHATTCDCNACVLIPNLDLKFFAHEGRYVIRHIGRSEELTGSDVVLIHRLLKGTSGDAIGTGAYAVYTDAAMTALGMDPSVMGFLEHTEVLESVGDVDVHVQNLAERWVFEQERNRVFVTKEAAQYEMITDSSAQPAVLWEWHTDPKRKMEWQEGLTSIGEDLDEGRRGIGAVSHCAHGPQVTLQKVVDWRPFTSFSIEHDIPGLPGILTTTTEFRPTESGTQIIDRVSANPPELWPAIKEALLPQLERNNAILESIIGTTE